MRRSILVSTAVSIAFTAIGTAGSITGTVKGNDGTTITAGAVTVSLQPDLINSRLRRISASAPIHSDGSFVLSPLTGGTYQICTETPGGPWLPSCDWGRAGTAVSLTARSSSVQTSVVLVKGAVVTIRVIDPSQLLAAHEGKTAGAHLLIGVRGDSRFFRAARIASRDAVGRNYEVAIPFDRSTNVSVANTLFQLADAAGAALPHFGNIIPVTVPSGQTARTLVLNVNGIASSPGR